VTYYPGRFMSFYTSLIGQRQILDGPDVVSGFYGISDNQFSPDSESVQHFIADFVYALLLHKADAVAISAALNNSNTTPNRSDFSAVSPPTTFLRDFGGYGSVGGQNWVVQDLGGGATKVWAVCRDSTAAQVVADNMNANY
jgi:hypothetical protein